MVKQSKTAAEILAELNKNNSYSQKIKKNENERELQLKLIKEDEKKISASLSEMDIYIESIYDLVNTNEPYPEAIPILVNFLNSDELSSNRIIEGIIRALGVKEAIGIANKPLLRLYNRTKDKDTPYLWAIGNTMTIIISEEDIDEVIKIITDKSNGMSRQMFVLALGNIPSEKSEDVLIQVLNDDEIAPHALEALGKLKSKKARDKISELTNHPKSLIKKEAKKALKKIG
jgi:HEAT repeat protein